MARLSYSERALRDLERLCDFLLASHPQAALATVDLIAEAVLVLERHPLIGRAVESGLRELTISRGRTGYVALYSFERSDDAVLILAIRPDRHPQAACDGPQFWQRERSSNALMPAGDQRARSRPKRVTGATAGRYAQTWLAG